MRNPHTTRGAWLALAVAAALAGTGCSSTPSATPATPAAPATPDASAAPAPSATGQGRSPAAAAPPCADGTTAATFANGASVCGSQAAVTPAGGSAVTVNTYLGIQYATAERFQAPVLAPPQGTGVVHTRPGAFCPQADKPSFPTSAQSENCLYLNVFTPQSAIGAARPLPVLFFIHGGAFVEGSGYLPTGQGNLYDGSYLAATGRMVVVTINYRLGALGFLALDQVDRSVDPNGSLQGNYGILDQQQALQWVQQYIGAFGGDPARVTVAGESAGAMSTGLHLFAAPGSAKLFQAAIMESNPVGSVYRTPDRAQAMGRTFRDALCARMGVQCATRQPILKKASVQEILDAQALKLRPAKARGMGKVRPKDRVQTSVPPLVGLLGEAAPQVRDGLPWSPTLDGTVITGQPLAGYAADMPAKPFVFGINRDEGAVFADMAATALEARLKPALVDGTVNGIILPWVFGQDGARAITSYQAQGTRPYKAPAASSPGYMSATAVTLSNIINDFAFRCGNLAMAGRGAAANAKAASAPPAFGYLFAQAPWFNLYRTGAPPDTKPIPACQPQAGNVCHANELPYVFNTLGAVPGTQQPSEGDRTLAQTMAAAWASFVNTPSSPAPWTASGNLPARWTPYTGTSSSLALWNTAGSGSVSAAAVDTGANCGALWNTIAPIAGN